jgi:hypothetical protein
MMPDQVVKWLRQQLKYVLLCCGFRRTGEAIGQVYQCWWRICREINVLHSFEYHMYYVLYPFVSYLLTLLRINKTHWVIHNGICIHILQMWFNVCICIYVSVYEIT